ncbi:MAG: GntR family transcriptional regulator [Caldiserica bacterium]|nr:GntR family transcriptional regulator [Caldisericota bacterium]
MEFYVNPYDGVPVYLQIIQLVRNGVALGTLHSGDQLPTVRELAVKLAVNPNTVAKAYRDLEREGMVETVSGKGTFVREGRIGVETERLAHMVEMLVVEARNAGLTIDDLIGRLEKRKEISAKEDDQGGSS